ncbi:MAG: TrmH family RNA methyltransferase [Planctomycetota bacterium]
MAGSYRPYRRDDPHGYAIGVFACLEMLTYAAAPLAVIVPGSSQPNAGLDRILAQADERGLEVVRGDRLLRRLSGKDNCLAVGVYRKQDAPLRAGCDHLVLIAPADAGNLGTIMRTMLGFGVHDLALVGSAVDHHQPRSVRASMGACFRLRVQRFAAWGDYDRTHPQSARYPLLSDATTPLRTQRFAAPCSLILGNESSGLDPSWHDVGTPVRIVHEQSIDSLNLALAAGIALHALAGQRSG